MAIKLIQNHGSVQKPVIFGPHFTNIAKLAYNNFGGMIHPKTVKELEVPGKPKT